MQYVKKKMGENMNIMYCGDANIVDGLVMSVLSILKHEKGIINIYLLSMDYNDKKIIPKKIVELLNKLLKETNEKSKAILINTEKVFKDNIPEANIDTFFTPYCMLRLYADLLPIPDKILYLDNDVLANKSFKDFYDLDISKYEMVGARDFYGKYFYSKNRITKEYLNSGVLLLNLELIKKNKSFQKCRELCQKKKMLLPDQAALNKYCNPRLIVKRKYNEQHKLKKDTVFRHFTTTFKFFPYFRTQKIKPWNIEKLHSTLKCYEFDDIIEKYLNLKENNYE